MAKGASAAGFVDTEDDQYERSWHEHPAGVKAARHPKVAERAIQVETSNEQASREPCVLLEPECSGHQGESAEEPGDRAEMQEPRHEPSERSGHPLVRKKRPDHEPLDHDAVKHRYGASDAPSETQASVLPSHAHTFLDNEDKIGTGRSSNTTGLHEFQCHERMFVLVRLPMQR